MSEPRRFLEEHSGLEQSLLRSAREDAPSPAARRRTLAALGLGAGALGVSATATAASTAAPSFKAAASLGLLKWIGFGVVSGALVVGAAEVARSVSPPPAKVTPAALDEGHPARRSEAGAVANDRAATPIEPPSAASVEATPIESPSAASVEATRGTSILEATPGAAVTAPPSGEALGAVAPPARIEPRSSAPPSPEPPRAHAASPSPASSALADEIAALDGARAALAAGDAAGALRALDARDRAFPRGALGPEARVVRIEALALRGDHAAAKRLGEAFLAASPHSPHASRIRALLGIAPPPAEPTP